MFIFTQLSWKTSAILRRRSNSLFLFFLLLSLSHALYLGRHAFHFDMLSSQFNCIFLLIATVAAQVPSTDWQLAFNGANLNTPNVDWTLANDLFAEEDARKLDIFQSFDDPDLDASFFTDDSQNLLLAGVSSDECSSSNPGRKRQEGNTMCSSSSSSGTVGIPATFLGGAEKSDLDKLYCPSESVWIVPLFICSSPNPAQTVPTGGFFTLIDSTRRKPKNIPPFHPLGRERRALANPPRVNSPSHNFHHRI